MADIMQSQDLAVVYLIAICDFSRKNKIRKPVINVYVILSQSHKRQQRIPYNRQKYKLYYLYNTKELKKLGYNKSVDKLYILMKGDVEKTIKKTPNLMVSAQLVYDEKLLIETLIEELK